MSETAMSTILYQCSCYATVEPECYGSNYYYGLKIINKTILVFKHIQCFGLLIKSNTLFQTANLTY